MSPRFSLIIPCLSSAEVLAQTLGGIAAQSFDSSLIQVIVIDDCSEPPLESTFLEFQIRSPVEAIYLRNSSNLGRAASRNRGLQIAEGEIVLFMDVDQLLEHDFLEQLDKAFAGEPRQSLRANTSVWPPLLGQSAFLRFYDGRFPGKRLAELAKFTEGLPPKFYATTCMATGREALLEVGGFDEDFKRYGCEDEELGVRLSKRGVHLNLCQDAKSYSTDGDLTVGRACRRLIDYARDSVPLILEKHPDYLSSTPLPLVETPESQLSLKLRSLKRLLFLLGRASLAKALLRLLEGADRNPRFNPAAKIYQAAFLGFYLMGVRARRAGR